MSKLYLVRHAKPSAGWGQDPDPGLDPTGVSQAEATAAQLQATLAPLPIYTSPMRRCRETSTPLTQLWGKTARVLQAVAEIPSPPLPLANRHEWLQAAMQGSWQQLQDSAPPGSPDFLAWRRALLAAVAAISEDSVIFSHYIAINAIVGSAQGNDAVISFRPDHASVTVVDSIVDGSGPSLRIVELGRQAQTTVLARG